MPPEVTVRPYESSDQPGVEWLYSRTPPWGRTYPRPEPIPDNISRIGEISEHAFVAVEQDPAGEAIVGLLAVTRPDALGSVPAPNFVGLTPRTLRLHWVLVAPERWRQGIGRRLVEAAIDWSRHQGFDAIFLDTTLDQEGAVHFYRALGFEELDHTHYRDWELVWFKLEL